MGPLTIFVLAAIQTQVPESPRIEVRFVAKSTAKADVFLSKIVFPQFQSTSLVAKLATDDTSNAIKSEQIGFMKTVREIESEGTRPVAELEHSVGSVVSIAKRDFVSLYVEVYDYSGGAHPNRRYSGMTWGLVDGKARRLKFGDLLKDGADPIAVASKAVVPKLIEAGASLFSGGEKAALDAEMTENFVVTPAGVTWIFSPYDAGPYTDGEFFIKVPWSELNESLRGSGLLLDRLGQ